MKKLLIFIAIPLLFSTSCATKKTLLQIKKQQEIFQSGFDSLQVKKISEPVLQPYDQLYIQIYTETLSQEQVAVFNSATDGKTTGAYTVDANGFIEIPILGKIEAKGKTIVALSEQIKRKVEPYVQAPGVLVKLRSFKVKVIGLSSSQQLLDLVDQKPTLIDALAKAGGLKDESSRDSIMVIREENGILKKYTVDLRDGKAIFESPAYQLQQNDIIYVPGNEIRDRMVFDKKRNSNTLWVTYVNVLIGVTTLLVFILR